MPSNVNVRRQLPFTHTVPAAFGGGAAQSRARHESAPAPPLEQRRAACPPVGRAAYNPTLVELVACLPPREEKVCAMVIPIDVLEAEALSLPPADRSRLVDRLLASLGHDPAWEEAWSVEADRREARITDGQTHWVSGPDAVARVRASLK